ncbi:unnamed protein product [Phaeothamnion confervicola]
MCRACCAPGQPLPVVGWQRQLVPGRCRAERATLPQPLSPPRPSRAYLVFRSRRRCRHLPPLLEAPMRPPLGRGCRELLLRTNEQRSHRSFGNHGVPPLPPVTAASSRDRDGAA